MSDRDRFDVRRRDVLKAAGALGAAAGMGGVVTATPGRAPGPKEDEVLVGVSKAAGCPREIVERHLPARARIACENRGLGYAAVRFPEEADERARENFVAAITDAHGVKYAEPNETREALLAPDDPRFGDQYAPGMVNADDGWDATLGSSEVDVAVIDTGVQYDHPDLSGNVRSDPGHDFVDGDSDPSPDVPADEFHGTHVAGVVGAGTDNGEGIAGVSDSTLFAGRALDEYGRGSTSDIADAVAWATDRGTDVINLSLGGGGHSSTLKNAVSYAYDEGVLLVAAAGNDGQRGVSYPAAYGECLAVSALNESGELAYYSDYGDGIELCAPGSNVLSTTTEERGSYEELSGTSVATPVVAGCAGLTLARWDLTNEELRSHLKDTAADVGLPADEQGSGRVDALAAVETDPSGDGDGEDDGGTESTASSVTDSLAGYWDADCWRYPWQYDGTSKVVVDLDGPADADFDLYANEGRAECPTTGDYDYRSWSPDSRETVSADDPDDSTDLYILVDSYTGGGEYAMTITEYR